jgi:hypothetical protein
MGYPTDRKPLKTDHRVKEVRTMRFIRTGILWGLIGLLGLTSTGCIQFAANLMNVIHGPAVPAEFKGFENKKVALVCSDESGIGRSEASIHLAGNLKGILVSKLPKTTFVNQQEIDQWVEGSSVSTHDWAAIGQGVNSDFVLAVDMQKLNLRQGPTLFRGQSDLIVTVWDVKQGKAAFRRSLAEYSYPQIAGMPSTETDEDKFRRIYLMNVASRIARYFYAHEFGEDYAVDATILSH